MKPFLMVAFLATLNGVSGTPITAAPSGSNVPAAHAAALLPVVATTGDHGDSTSLITVADDGTGPKPDYLRESVTAAASSVMGLVGGLVGTAFGHPIAGAVIAAGFGAGTASWLYDLFFGNKPMMQRTPQKPRP